MDFQAQVRAKGEEIFKKIDSQSKASIFQSILHKDWWYGRIMDWSMKNEHFKVQMFRFVDVLPTLTSNNEVAKHLKEYFIEQGDELPPVFNMGFGLGALAPGLMASAIKKNVLQMAQMFITGETPEQAIQVLKKSRKNKISFTVDILGEATLSEKEALEYQRRYLELIEWLAKDVSSSDSKSWEDIPQLDQDHKGAIPKLNVSVKMSALYSQVNDKAWAETKNILKERLRPIFHSGVKNGVFVNLDMENYGVKHLTLEVFKDLINEPDFKNYPYFGCVIQAYLRDSYSDCQGLIDFAKARGTPFTVRLVKGAYWDYETIEAQQKRWSVPVYTNKQESDANFESCTKLLYDHHKFIGITIGSHNVRSIAHAIVYAQKIGLPLAAIEVQMLFGMAEPIKKALVEMGIRVREYAPVGELLPGMAYLVRRLLENTSNESFLRSKFVEGGTSESLLKEPGQDLRVSSAELKVENRFYNEPPKDWAVEANRLSIQQSLQKFDRTQFYPLVIANRDVKTDRSFQVRNPGQTKDVLGEVAVASIQEADLALAAAQSAFSSWKNVSGDQRARLVEKLADLMRRDHFDLMACQILEVGKPWAEADGDIGEAIDFCQYYARQMRELSLPIRVGNVPGEVSHYQYSPRGVCLVIAPWNFPLAIITGMVAAAVVTGNTVIMKPAEQSSITAWHLMRLAKEAGFPEGVINFLPGFGEEVGEYLVKHKDISTIAFTGSKSVGLHILVTAAQVSVGQKQIKRCITEMGGKNAVIIDNDADLDEAVDGVVSSAFGFAGQKCSACSRVVVLEEVYDRFVDRLVEATKSIEVGQATHPSSYFGPVIDQEAFERIQNVIRDAKKNHTLLFEGAALSSGASPSLGGSPSSDGSVGFFIGPTIFGDVAPQSWLAQNEVFGPVLAVMRAKDIDQAIQIANETEYALTGGLFSRSPGSIDKVRNGLEVGNLYINRGITGAMVDRHPFGGFKMSGVGSKTGGPDYLKQFVEPRSITENTLRRGFAPVEGEEEKSK